MSNIINMAEWKKALTTPTPTKTYRSDDPDQGMTDCHHLAGYPNRAAYFWDMSELYGIDYNEIELRAMRFGSQEDFGKLVKWLHINDTRRNR